MIKIYFKQAFRLLRENKLLSSISIIGTALAIAMIMVIVITLRATIAPFSPEDYRDRMMIFKYAGLQHKVNANWLMNGPLSYQTAKACFKEMPTPEAVSIVKVINETMLASLPAGDKISCNILQTDDAFWNVFNFNFIAGAPYTKADFDAEATKAVVAEDVARRLFGRTDVAGETFLLNNTLYIVSGVVSPVSKLSTYAYAQIWIPLSSTEDYTATWGAENLMGSFSALILARSPDDFSKIRAEAEAMQRKYMESHPDWKLLYRGQPDSYFTAANRVSSMDPPSVKEAIREYVVTLIILLIVPAVNLSGLTLSRMQKRISEVGVRKAFGASRKELMMQILSENMLYSILGGILGLLLSFAAILMFGQMFFSVDFASNGFVDMYSLFTHLLFDPLVFLLAFLSCFVLNLLSALIPAWRITRVNVIDAINQK